MLEKETEALYILASSLPLSYIPTPFQFFISRQGLAKLSPLILVTLILLSLLLIWCLATEDQESSEPTPVIGPEETQDLRQHII